MPASEKKTDTPEEDIFLPAPDLPPPLDDDADPELLHKDYYEERRQEERRAATIRRRLLITGVVIATVAGPLVFLRATGKLTRKSVARVVTRSTPAPRGIAQPSKQGFGNKVVKPLDAVAKDLQEYTNNTLPNLAPLENKAVFDFASVTGTNFRGNEEGTKVIRERVIPEFKLFLEKAGEVTPKTEEVRAIHRIFMESERAKGRAYTAILDGIEQKNNAKIKVAQDQFAEARRQSELFMTRLKAVSEKHDILLQGF